jgi:hypothetical protein
MNVKLGAVACSFATLAMGLVSAWAQYQPPNQIKLDAPPNNYLGEPSWRSNVFAWHPVLMVCGFYFSQVMSMAGISMFHYNKGATFLWFLFWTLAAIATLVAGLRAIVKYKWKSEEDQLITLHSWLGIVTLLVFAFSSTYGLYVGLNGMIYKMTDPSRLKSMGPIFTQLHMKLAMITLGVSSTTVLTGITVYHGEFGCDALHINSSRAHINPGHTYYRYPWGCRLSNGAGLAVIFATTFTVLSLLMTRSVAIYDEVKGDDQDNSSAEMPSRGNDNQVSSSS